MSDVTPPVEAPPVADPAPQPGPWATDLEQYFEDEQARALADRFLREKVQPRVTQFEQAAAKYEPAHRLYDDLLQDTDGTVASIISEVYGDEAAAQWAGLRSPAEPTPADPAPAPVAAEPPPLDPQVAEAVEYFQNQQRQDAWNQTLTTVRQTIPDLDEGEFSPFVISAGGNIEQATAAYQQWRAGVEARYAPVLPPAPDPVPPPAPLGTAGPGGAPPPVTQNYANLDEALDAFLAEKRAAAPAAVGSV